MKVLAIFGAFLFSLSAFGQQAGQLLFNRTNNKVVVPERFWESNKTEILSLVGGGGGGGGGGGVGSIPTYATIQDLLTSGAPFASGETVVVLDGGSFSGGGGGVVFFLHDAASSEQTNTTRVLQATTGRWIVRDFAMRGPVLEITKAAVANTNLVPVAPSTAFQHPTGAANFGPSSGTAWEFLQGGHDFKVRQDGTVVGARVYVPATTGITGYRVSVWRARGTVWNLVGRSEDLSGRLTAGALNELIFSTPIPGVREGDQYGIQVLSSGGLSAQVFTALTSGFDSTAPSVFSMTSAAASTNVAWGSQTVNASSAVVCELLMTAPTAIFIGHSIAAGHGANSTVEHYSYLESSAIDHASNSWPYRVARALGWSYQNMGRGGNKLYDPVRATNVFDMGVSNRIVRDAIAFRPKYVFFEIGRNDVTGSTTTEQYTNSWRVILDLCLASNAIPVINLMHSGNDLSSGNLALVDTWNSSLSAMVAAAYPEVVLVETKTFMNQFNPSYPAVLTNLYAYIPQLNSGDNIHPSPEGYARLANATLAAVARAVVRGTLDVRGGLTVGGDVTSDQVVTGNIRTEDGTASVPPIASKYEQSGTGRSSTGNWSFWIGGNRELDLSSSRLGPAADGGLNLGTPGADRFDKIYPRTAFVAPYGTNSVPSYSFYQHENSGFFFNDVATDTISLVGDGVRYWDFRTSDGAWAAATDGGANIGRDGADRPGNVYAFNSVKAPTIWATSNLLTSGRTVATPASVQTLAPATQIVVSNTTVALVAGSNGPVTLTGTTTIPPGVDGQHVVVIGTSDTNTVTLQDESVLSGTWLVMGGQNRTLGRGDCVGLRYSSSVGKWVMEFFSKVSSGTAGAITANGTNIVESFGRSSTSEIKLTNKIAYVEFGPIVDLAASSSVSAPEIRASGTNEGTVWMADVTGTNWVGLAPPSPILTGGVWRLPASPGGGILYSTVSSGTNIQLAVLNHPGISGLSLVSTSANSFAWGAGGGGGGSSPTTDQGDMIVRGTSFDERLPIGPPGMMLTSDGTGPRWGDLSVWRIGPEDLLVGSLPASDMTGLTGNGGAGFSAGNNGEVGHPGIAMAHTGSQTNGYGGGMGRQGAIVGGTGVGPMFGEMILKTDPNNLSDSTNRYQVLAGFFDQNSTVANVDGVYSILDGTTNAWQFITQSNSAATTNAVNVPAAIATWYRLSWYIATNGTSAVFSVDGTKVATNTLNIPSGTARAYSFGALIVKIGGSVGTAQRNLYLDAYVAGGVR